MAPVVSGEGMTITGRDSTSVTGGCLHDVLRGDRPPSLPFTGHVWRGPARHITPLMTGSWGSAEPIYFMPVTYWSSGSTKLQFVSVIRGALSVEVTHSEQFR
jgi:hypothetical protein